MIVKCIYSEDDSLTIDNHYTVYALNKYNNKIEFYLVDNYQLYYPIGYSSIYFEVIDPRFSKYWVTKPGLHDWSDLQNNQEKYQFLSFSEWCKDKNFYENLVDGLPSEVEIFINYKDKMDMEFRDPDCKKEAIKLNNNWIQCPECFEAWEYKGNNEMVICPNCKISLWVKPDNYFEFDFVEDKNWEMYQHLSRWKEQIDNPVNRSIQLDINLLTNIGFTNIEVTKDKTLNADYNGFRFFNITIQQPEQNKDNPGEFNSDFKYEKAIKLQSDK